MAHDNYDKFYTWNGGTLVLDPGVFTFGEPQIQMCDRIPVHATGLDRVLDPYEQQFCAKPMRFMSTKHAPVPVDVAARCDTIVPGRSYCCPPYMMPSDWRVDYMPLGDDGEAVQDVGVIIAEAQQSVAVVQQDTATRLRSMIRQQPLAAMTIGVLGGMILGKMLMGR